MKLSQSPRVAATFDEVNLLPSAGLVPVMRLARRAGLESLVTRIVPVPGGAGANAAAKVASIVAGMVTGRTASTTWMRCGRARWARCCPG